MTPQGLPSRGLKPAAILAANRAHGDRLRYIGGCRCDLCRAANTAYERDRKKARLAGDWNGIVSAENARRHIAHLASIGVGRRAIGDATDIADTVLVAIKSGDKQNIRARTERLILAVTAEVAADHALVDAAPTWKLIGELLAAGFTKTEISHRLGNKTHALQLGKKQVLVKHAAQMKRIHNELINSDQGLIDARPTWRIIEKLRTEEYTDKQIARKIGFPDGELRLSKRRVTRAHASIVEQLYQAAEV